MNKTTNQYITAYQVALLQGDIQIAYERLIKTVMAMKVYFEKVSGTRYSFGNVSPGYMDYTYFPFYDEFLRTRKLRFGIVLNHKQMCFEIWLMGQNAQVQKEYWELLKATKWNERQVAMPRYSVLETVLVEHPDFDNQDALFIQIHDAAAPLAEEVIHWISAIS